MDELQSREKKSMGTVRKENQWIWLALFMGVRKEKLGDRKSVV